MPQEVCSQKHCNLRSLKICVEDPAPKAWYQRLGKPKWPPLYGHWNMARKRSTKSTPIVLALFRLFSVVFDRFRTFSLVCTLFGLSVSDRFWPSVFALFRTIRLLPFSGCDLDSPEQCLKGECQELTTIGDKESDLPSLRPSWWSLKPQTPTRKLQPSVTFKGGA